MTDHLARMLKDVSHLTAEQCIAFERAYTQQIQKVQSTLVLREAEGAIKMCPHCGCDGFTGAGSSKDGRKRFKCRACAKTFNAYTGSPLSGLHLPEKHIEHAQCMIDGLSIRETAKKLGVNTKTVFLWRHRFLIALEATQPEKLSGIVEADETFFLESFKGQRGGLPRPAKVRGTKANQRGLSKEQIPVLVARDRSTGATLTAKIPSRRAKDIGDKLLPVLSEDTVLCSDGARAYKALGKQAGIEVFSVVGHVAGNPYHVNNVNAYDSRLKGWMHRFYGVSTKYLPNYLGWHRMLDRADEDDTAKSLVEKFIAFR